MRSSNKSRSRNKSQNRRPTTNVVNRVFDSTGPEGKVRGTPQQIVEKYQSLARDAHLSGDRVAAENFQQHSEHYTRLLNDAMQEQNARREAHEAQQAQHAQRREAQQNNNQTAQNNQNSPAQTQEPDQASAPESPQPQDPQHSDQPDVIEAPHEVNPVADAADNGLVETPEGKAPTPSRRKKPTEADQAAE